MAKKKAKKARKVAKKSSSAKKAKKKKKAAKKEEAPPGPKGATLEGVMRMNRRFAEDMGELRRENAGLQMQAARVGAVEEQNTDLANQLRELEVKYNASVAPLSTKATFVADRLNAFDEKAASAPRGKNVVTKLETGIDSEGNIVIQSLGIPLSLPMKVATMRLERINGTLERIEKAKAINLDLIADPDARQAAVHEIAITDNLAVMIEDLERDSVVLARDIEMAKESFVLECPILTTKRVHAMVHESEIPQRRILYHEAEGRRQQRSIDVEAVKKHIGDMPTDTAGRPMPSQAQIQLVIGAYPKVVEQMKAQLALETGYQETIEQQRQMLAETGGKFRDIEVQLSERGNEIKSAGEKADGLRKRIAEIEAEAESTAAEHEEALASEREAGREEGKDSLQPDIKAKAEIIASLKEQLEGLQKSLEGATDPDKMHAWKEDGKAEAKRDYDLQIAEKETAMAELRQQLEAAARKRESLEKSIEMDGRKVVGFEELVATLRRSLEKARGLNDQLIGFDEARQKLVKTLCRSEFDKELKAAVDSDEHPVYTTKTKAKQDLDAAVAEALKGLCGAIEEGCHDDYMTNELAKCKEDSAVKVALKVLKSVIKSDADLEFMTRNLAAEQKKKAEEESAKKAVRDERKAIDEGKRKFYLSVRNLDPILQKARIRAETALMKKIVSGEHEDYITRGDARRETDKQMREQMERHVGRINNGVDPFFVPRLWHDRVTKKFDEYKAGMPEKFKRIAITIKMRESRRERQRTLALIDSGDIGGYCSGKQMRDFALRYGRKVIDKFRKGVESGEIHDFVTAAKHKAKLGELEDARVELENAIFEIDALEYEAHHLKSSRDSLADNLRHEQMESARLAGIEESIPELTAKAASDARNSLIRLINSGDHPCFVPSAVHSRLEDANNALESELATTNLRALFSGIKTTEEFDAFMGSAGFVLMPDGKYKQDDIDRAAEMLAESYSEWEVRARYQLTPKFLDEVVSSRLVVKLNVGGNSMYYVSAPEFVGALRDKGNELINARKSARKPKPAKPKEGDETPQEEHAEGGEQRETQPEEETRPPVSIDYGDGIQPSPIEKIAWSKYSAKPAQIEEVDQGKVLYARAQRARHEAKGEEGYNRALELLQEATNAGFNDPIMFCTELGVNLMMLGRRETAASMFELVAKLNPSGEVKQVVEHNLNLIYSGSDAEKAAKFAALEGDVPGIVRYKAPDAVENGGINLADLLPKGVLPDGVEVAAKKKVA